MFFQHAGGNGGNLSGTPWKRLEQILMPPELTNVCRVQPQTLSRTTDIAKRTLVKSIAVKLIPESRVYSEFRLIINQRVGISSQQALRKILDLDLPTETASKTYGGTKKRLHFEM